MSAYELYIFDTCRYKNVVTRFLKPVTVFKNVVTKFKCPVMKFSKTVTQITPDFLRKFLENDKDKGSLYFFY